MKPEAERVSIWISFPAEGRTDDAKNEVSFFSRPSSPDRLEESCELHIESLEADGELFYGFVPYNGAGYTPGGQLDLRSRGEDLLPNESQFEILWAKCRALREAALGILGVLFREG